MFVNLLSVCCAVSVGLFGFSFKASVLCVRLHDNYTSAKCASTSLGLFSGPVLS